MYACGNVRSRPRASPDRPRSIRPIILITGHGDIDMAVSAVKTGAFDFIENHSTQPPALQHPQCGEQGRRRANEMAGLEKLQVRFQSLSLRQRQVMELAAAGFRTRRSAPSSTSVPNRREHRAWVMSELERAISQSSCGSPCKSYSGVDLARSRRPGCPAPKIEVLGYWA